MWDAVLSRAMDGKRAVVALALTLVVSCGGTAPTSTSGTGVSNAVATNPASATGSVIPATAQPTANAGQPKLNEVLASAKLSEYKVTYKITATGVPASEQTWYFKPPRTRFDFGIDMGGGQKTVISFFTLPDGTFYCFAAAGQSQCLSVPGVGSPLDANMAAVAQQSLIGHPDQYGATFKEAKTIAGQAGLCYEVTGSPAGAFSAGNFCYTKDGLSLLSSFTVQGSTWTTEATNLSRTVPDSDFTLPAKPLGP